MLKVGEAWLNDVEKTYPGLRRTIMDFEAAELPPCPHCGSTSTASVQCGIIGRTIHLSAATDKVRLLANGPKPGQYACNTCREYFD